MRLNQREVDLLSVTWDLFLKGTPEYRVAKYAREQKFTELQLRHYLDKLPCLDSPTKGRIMNHFRDLENGDCFDESIKTGHALENWVKAQEKVEITK